MDPLTEFAVLAVCWLMLVAYIFTRGRQVAEWLQQRAGGLKPAPVMVSKAAQRPVPARSRSGY